MSRRFAATLLRTILTENVSSHHEIFLPYVLSLKASFKFEELQRSPIVQIQPSIGRVERFAPLCAVSMGELITPVKSICGELQGYDVATTSTSAKGYVVSRAASSAQGYVVSSAACRALCDNRTFVPPLRHGGVLQQQLPQTRELQMSECTAWVYDSKQRCYLTGGRQLRWKKATALATVAGLPTHSAHKLSQKPGTDWQSDLQPAKCQQSHHGRSRRLVETC